MPSIRALFKNTSTEAAEEFKGARCLLLISVGQEAHEGERFSSTVDLINHSFQECYILLYDTLQRYTMALSSMLSPGEFQEIAGKEGDLWLKRNHIFCNKLSILKKVLRWDQWLQHPAFLTHLDYLKRLLELDPAYKASLEATVDHYLERYTKHLINLSHFDLKRAQALCLDYLLEECAVLCIWPELGCQFEVYTNWHNQAFIETKKRIISPQYPNLLRSVRIGFRHAKQVKPQRFIQLENQEFVT